jgi:hypothetical protein
VVEEEDLRSANPSGIVTDTFDLDLRSRQEKDVAIEEVGSSKITLPVDLEKEWVVRRPSIDEVGETVAKDFLEALVGDTDSPGFDLSEAEFD